MHKVEAVATTNDLSDPSGKAVVHRDGLGRLWEGPETDPRRMKGAHPDQAYLRPEDGRLDFFTVQRTPATKFPRAIRVLEWMFSRDAIPGKADEKASRNRVLRRWVPGSFAILFLMCIPGSYEGEIRNGGRYDPVRYREWLYAKVPRNISETPGFDVGSDSDGEDTALLHQRPGDIEMGQSTAYGNRQSTQIRGFMPRADSAVLQREQGPRFLCFVDDTSMSTSGYSCKKVSDWMRDRGVVTAPKFVFLSYTRKQFCVATAAEISKWSVPSERKEDLVRMSFEDRLYLLRLGCQIAKAAGLPAFWLDFECLKPDDNSVGQTGHSGMSDVYRICDIVRVSSSMVIIRGPSIDARHQPVNTSNKGEWLKEWGTRLWTVPEALLCPSKAIDIYTRGEDLEVERIEKRRLAASAWSDADKMKDLIDHYEASLQLTPLELVSIAFEGLQWRKTDQMTPGDTSYALMGLLRRRPLVVDGDSDFEAFARLSLANDSDMLLERLLCMQPPSYASPWHQIEDAWHAHLWDIQPHCQVAGIVDNRTVTLDGAFAATIHWHSLEPVAFIKRTTMLRTIAKALVRAAPIYILLAIILLGEGAGVQSAMSGYGSEYGSDSSQAMNGIEIGGIVILVLSLLLALATPALLYRLYRGKFWSTQAWFFGIEGVPDLGEVETCLFGLNDGRLKWSPFGSLLSRHHRVRGECVGLPPQGVDTAGMKVYTIIDTFTMTATAFHAARPPSTVMICGKEGGMQRAVLCSYDWRTQTFCREAVLRMKTLVLERMSRIDRFRFCLHRGSRDVVLDS